MVKSITDNAYVKRTSCQAKIVFHVVAMLLASYPKNDEPTRSKLVLVCLSASLGETAACLLAPINPPSLGALQNEQRIPFQLGAHYRICARRRPLFTNYQG